MFIPTQQRTQPTGSPCRHKNAKGFTLLELLVVVAIIAVLASIALPMYRSYVDKAQVAVAISTLDSIRINFESYHIDYQEYPPEPIVDGIDGAGRRAFPNVLLNQVNEDITDVIYNSTFANRSYTLTAKARDIKQTALILTPSAILKAP